MVKKKKIIICFLILFSLFFITGCKNEKEESIKKNLKKTDTRSVVLYFSATGTTERIAEMIARKTESDIIEIIPKEEYKKEDLNYKCSKKI